MEPFSPLAMRPSNIPYASVGQRHEIIKVCKDYVPNIYSFQVEVHCGAASCPKSDSDYNIFSRQIVMTNYSFGFIEETIMLLEIMRYGMSVSHTKELNHSCRVTQFGASLTH
jgi:hypothetical protein